MRRPSVAESLVLPGLLLVLLVPGWGCGAPTDSEGGDAGVTDGGAGASDGGSAADGGGSAADGGGIDAGFADGGFTPPWPGQPEAGTLFWGASIGGNGDPVERHETPSGHVLALRRTFWQWNHRTTNLRTTAAGDLAAGRLPWVSIKTPSWADMAAGLHDDEIDELLTGLDALDGPVWLTIHHEPEGGGGVNEPDDPAGPAGHLAMNQRVRARMDALGTDNVALAPILMSWTWVAASGRDPNEWWADGVYDFLGVDHYRDSENTLLNQTWDDIRLWAEARGIDVAVGEWGMRGTDAAAGQRVRDWYEAGIASAGDGAGARVVGLSCFDSNLNSPTGGWELMGEQLVAFRELLGDPRTAHIP